MKYIKELLQIAVLFTILIGVLHAQDSTAIQLKIDAQMKLRNTIQSQVMRGQVDLDKIDYAIFVLNEMLKPPKEEEKNEEKKE